MATTKARQTTTEVFWWSWSENNEGKSPVKLRVTNNRKRRYYPITHNNAKLFLSSSEWKVIQDRDKSVRGDNKAIRASIDRAKADADRAINRITQNDRPFTWDRFESEYITQDSAKGLLKLFADHLETIRGEGRIGTWKAYKNAYSAFNKFRGGDKDKTGKELSPIDLTPALLKQFDSSMETGGAGKNSRAMYMRALKVIFNLAVSLNPSLGEFNPFAKGQADKGKFKIRIGAGHKGEALNIDQLQAFMAIPTEPETEQDEAKQIWLFSFHAQGMNLRDIALLKYSNIKGEVITYIRQKTRETETTETPIEIPLNDALRKIIVTLGNPDKKPGAYVFQILGPGMNIEKQDGVIRQKIKMINRRLKELCEANSLPAITTYWARHSYANLQKQSGASVEEIRELLGHSDMRTTEAYLKRFDIERKKKANERIEELFKNKVA